MVLFHHRSLSMVKEVGGMVLFHHRSCLLPSKGNIVRSFPPYVIGVWLENYYI